MKSDSTAALIPRLLARLANLRMRRLRCWRGMALIALITESSSVMSLRIRRLRLRASVLPISALVSVFICCCIGVVGSPVGAPCRLAHGEAGGESVVDSFICFLAGFQDPFYRITKHQPRLSLVAFVFFEWRWQNYVLRSNKTLQRLTRSSKSF